MIYYHGNKKYPCLGGIGLKSENRGKFRNVSNFSDPLIELSGDRFWTDSRIVQLFRQSQGIFGLTRDLARCHDQPYFWCFYTDISLFFSKYYPPTLFLHTYPIFEPTESSFINFYFSLPCRMPILISHEFEGKSSSRFLKNPQ